MKFIAIVLFSMLLGVCFADDCPCTYEYKPVCASNGITYANKCVFECAKRSDADLKIVYEGVCKEGRRISEDCDCPDVVDPVCTDRGTFANSCYIGCYESENPSKPVTILHKGVCAFPA